jgi:tyrosinase
MDFRRSSRETVISPENIMISRRRFLQSSVSLALVPLLPRVALSADLRTRPSWEVFCTEPTFASLCNAIAAMKANKNSADPNAWTYWSETHRQFCPHGVAYFLAWHRGFLYRFETRLRMISGDPNLVLPYWNYYDNPNVPAALI